MTLPAQHPVALRKSARVYLRIVSKMLPLSQVYTATNELRAHARAAGAEASEYLRNLYREYGRAAVRDAINIARESQQNTGEK